MELVQDIECSFNQKSNFNCSARGFSFGGTIKENIAYGVIDAEEPEIIDAAMKANAHEFIEKLPDGYETTVGDRGQIIWWSAPKNSDRQTGFPIHLFFIDEAPVIDSESELLVQEALESLMVGRTCIVIAHRLSTIH